MFLKKRYRIAHKKPRRKGLGCTFVIDQKKDFNWILSEV